MKKKLLQWFHNTMILIFTLLFPSKKNMTNYIILLVAEMPLSFFTAVIKGEPFVYLGEDKSCRNMDG